MFKNGDDLRQDITVLQMFKIMDRLWQEDGQGLDMITYDVMETGFETGYIEFVDKSVVISEMHHFNGYYCGTFNQESVMNFFLKSIAGQKANETGWEELLKQNDEGAVERIIRHLK
jgi:hypothetical protein